MTLQDINRASGAAVGFLAAVVLFAAIAVTAKYSINPPAIDADRSAERSKALAEIRTAEEKSLTTSAVIDGQRGIVRLPIEDAIKFAAQKWQDPAQARADLISRAEKAAAPVKPVSFE
jgi:hypothetical protein